MRLASALTILLTLNDTFLFADSYPRNEKIDVLHYKFELTLTDKSDEILGRASITIKFQFDGISDFELDLVGRASSDSARGMIISDVRENEEPVHYTHVENRIHLRLDSPVNSYEQRTYTISYHGVPADGLIISKNKFGERTFFGDNWPNRARHWLPTVDHPYDKATCEFIVTAPAHYDVVANGLLEEVSTLADGRERTHWRTSVPMPTKVMVIGAADFAVDTAGVYNGRQIQSWVYAKDREAGFYDFAQAVRVLEFFDRHIGPFPYAKLANVQSKTKYGGMENASAIFYNEARITGNRDNEGLIAHEIAHQWFGDSVTEADWHHVWLSEGFATYFAWVFDEFTYSRDRFLHDLQAGRNRVLDFYRIRPELSIIDSSITDLNDLLNANTYPKAAWVLHMLRGTIGEQAFWQGIREYYRRFRDKNALTQDFRQVMEEAASTDLSWFFKQWLLQPGQPDLRGSWTYDVDSKELSIEINQVQERLFRLPLQLGIDLGREGTTLIKTVMIGKKQNTARFALAASPVKVVPDPDLWILMESDFEQK